MQIRSSMRTKMPQGEYWLKKECWRELDLYHPRWNPRDLQKAEERYQRALQLAPVAEQARRWRAPLGPFEGLREIATSALVCQVVQAVLYHALLDPPGGASKAPDGVLHVALHLLALALDACQSASGPLPSGGWDLHTQPSASLAGGNATSAPTGGSIGGNAAAAPTPAILKHAQLKVYVAVSQGTTAFCLFWTMAALDEGCLAALEQLAPEILGQNCGQAGGEKLGGAHPQVGERAAGAAGEVAAPKAAAAKMKEAQAKFPASMEEPKGGKEGEEESEPSSSSTSTSLMAGGERRERGRGEKRPAEASAAAAHTDNKGGGAAASWSALRTPGGARASLPAVPSPSPPPASAAAAAAASLPLGRFLPASAAGQVGAYEGARGPRAGNNDDNNGGGWGGGGGRVVLPPTLANYVTEIFRQALEEISNLHQAAARDVPAGKLPPHRRLLTLALRENATGSPGEGGAGTGTGEGLTGGSGIGEEEEDEEGEEGEDGREGQDEVLQDREREGEGEEGEGVREEEDEGRRRQHEQELAPQPQQQVQGAGGRGAPALAPGGGADVGVAGLPRGGPFAAAPPAALPAGPRGEPERETQERGEAGWIAGGARGISPLTAMEGVEGAGAEEAEGAGGRGGGNGAGESSAEQGQVVPSSATVPGGLPAEAPQQQQRAERPSRGGPQRRLRCQVAAPGGAPGGEDLTHRMTAGPLRGGAGREGDAEEVEEKMLQAGAAAAADAAQDSVTAGDPAQRRATDNSHGAAVRRVPLSLPPSVSVGASYEALGGGCGVAAVGGSSSGSNLHQVAVGVSAAPDSRQVADEGDAWWRDTWRQHRRGLGVHVMGCGHGIHKECFDCYFYSLLQRHVLPPRAARHRSHVLYEGFNVVHPEAGEFLCPMCRRLANAMLPIGDPLPPPPLPSNPPRPPLKQGEQGEEDRDVLFLAGVRMIRAGAAAPLRQGQVSQSGILRLPGDRTLVPHGAPGGAASSLLPTGGAPPAADALQLQLCQDEFAGRLSQVAHPEGDSAKANANGREHRGLYVWQALAYSLASAEVAERGTPARSVPPIGGGAAGVREAHGAAPDGGVADLQTEMPRTATAAHRPSVAARAAALTASVDPQRGSVVPVLCQVGQASKEHCQLTPLVRLRGLQLYLGAIALGLTRGDENAGWTHTPPAHPRPLYNRMLVVA
eukprot:jgi/Mesen1/5572/ME000281S04633